MKAVIATPIPIYMMDFYLNMEQHVEILNRCGYEVTIAGYGLAADETETQKEGYRIVTIPVRDAKFPSKPNLLKTRLENIRDSEMSGATKSVPQYRNPILNMLGGRRCAKKLLEDTTEVLTELKADLYWAYNDLSVLLASNKAARYNNAILAYEPAHYLPHRYPKNSHIQTKQNLNPLSTAKKLMRKVVQNIGSKSHQERYQQLLQCIDILVALDSNMLIYYYSTSDLWERDDLSTIILPGVVPSGKECLEPNNLLREQLGLAQEQIVIIYQGGLQKGRGLHNAIRSLEYLPDRFVLVLLGFGWEDMRKYLQDLAINLGFKQRVYILDPVPARELIKYTAGADVGIIPLERFSLNYFLAFPAKFCEYISAGIPIVASDFPVMRRVIIDEEIGEVFNPESPEDIARSILDVVSQENYSKYKENAVRLFKSKYNLDFYGKRAIDTLRKVMELKEEKTA